MIDDPTALEEAYLAAWAEWHGGEAALWEVTVGDGVTESA